MSDHNQFTRRGLLKTAGGIALVSGISAPAILRAQTADIIKTGNTYPVGTLLDSRATSKEYRKSAVALLELAEAARDMDEAIVAYNALVARIEASKTA